MKYLIVGLGNPGSEYELTRHNIGFLTIDQLADSKNGKFETNKLAEYAEIKNRGKAMHLIKPTTFMNLSGKSVNYWLQKLKLNQSNLLVVTDDTALPFGKLRLRAKGSDAGHNGMKDIETVLGNNNYARLRIGIGDDFNKGWKVDYVLGRFSDSEMSQLEKVIEEANQMILSFVNIGIERTMNLFN